MTYEEILNVQGKLYPVNSVPKGFAFYKNLLLEKCFGMFTYDGLPETLPAEQLENRLIMTGYAAVFNNKKAGGLVTSYGGLSGVDKYYLPTDFVYAQPALGSGNLKLHEDCVVIWNSQVDQYERLGLWDLIRRYARLLADFDSSINIATVNYRSTKNNVAATDQVAKTIDTAMRQIELGQRYTINQNSILDLYKTVPWNDEKDGKIQELLAAKEQTLSNFLSEIGVKTAKDKRERVITDEMSADNQLLTVNTEDFLRWRKKGVEEINKVFGTNITVKKSDEYTIKGGESNVINGLSENATDFNNSASGTD